MLLLALKFFVNFRDNVFQLWPVAIDIVLRLTYFLEKKQNGA